MPSVAQSPELSLPARRDENDNGETENLEAGVVVHPEEPFDINVPAEGFDLPTQSGTLHGARAEHRAGDLAAYEARADEGSDSSFDFAKPASSKRPPPRKTSPHRTRAELPRLRQSVRSSKRTLLMRDDDDDDDEDEYISSQSKTSSSEASSRFSRAIKGRRRPNRRSAAGPLQVPRKKWPSKWQPTGGRNAGARSTAPSLRRPPTGEEIANAAREAAEMSDFLRRGYHSLFSRKKKQREIARLRAIAGGEYVTTDAEGYSSLDSQGRTRSERVAALSPRRGSSAEEEGYNTDGQPVGTAAQEQARKEKIRRMEMKENAAKRLAKEEAKKARMEAKAQKEKEKQQEPKPKKAKRGRPRKRDVSRRSRSFAFSNDEDSSQSALEVPTARRRPRDRPRRTGPVVPATPHLLAPPAGGIFPGVASTPYPMAFLSPGAPPSVLATPHPLAFSAAPQVHPWGIIHSDLQPVQQAYQGPSYSTHYSFSTSYQLPEAPPEYRDPWRDPPLSAPLPPMQGWSSMRELETMNRPGLVQPDPRFLQTRPAQPPEFQQRPSRVTSYSQPSLPTTPWPQPLSQPAQEYVSTSITSQANSLSLVEQRLAQISIGEHPDETLPPGFTPLQQHHHPEIYSQQAPQAGYSELLGESNIVPEFWQQFEQTEGQPPTTFETPQRQGYPTPAPFYQSAFEGNWLSAQVGRGPEPSDEGPLLSGDRNRQFRDNFDNDDDLYTEEW